jgi:hypothetical protein
MIVEGEWWMERSVELLRENRARLARICLVRVAMDVLGRW